MGEITAITPQIKDKTRCNVYVDGRFYCGITLEAAMKNRLKAGQEIDEKRLDAMQIESEKNTALDKALTHISACSKTEKDVRQFLRKKGYLSSVEEYVAEKMKSYGFIDDKAYAKSYALSALKRKGRKLVEYELYAKGVSKEDIKAAFDEIYCGDGDESAAEDAGVTDERRAAEAVAEKFMRGKTADLKTLSALYRRLISRGFAGDTVKEIADKYREESEE
ncbi:MAG: RecX family transcriptional regulator [Candidatus Scatosoma sp.]